MKRFAAFLLALLCITSTALADGELSLSTDRLPSCYRYPIEGANIVYADAPITVYTSQTMNETQGYVDPNQAVWVVQADFRAGMVYIYYSPTDRQALWEAVWKYDTRSEGWIESRYVTTYINDSFYSNTLGTFVVTANKPGNRLNLRTKPSADSLSLGKYYAGTIVWQQEAPKDGYMKVRIGHMAGFMDVRFLEKGLYTPDAELPQLTVTASTEIHKMPAEDSEIIKTVPRNAMVTLLAVRDDDWVQIIYENETGFAHNFTMTPQLEF